MANQYVNTKNGKLPAPLPNCICQKCGRSFYLKPSYLKLGMGRFCNDTCRYAMTLIDRFWSKVNQSPGQGPQGTCWEWTHGALRGGYGAIAEKVSGHKKIHSAHRLSWEIHKGAIPDVLCVLHRCDNPPCVNPAHLFLGTRLDNNQDMANKGRCIPSNGHRVLTDEQVLEMRQRYTGARDQAALFARDYGITPGYARMIINRKCYKRLP